TEHSALSLHDALPILTYLLRAFGHTTLKAMDGEEGLQLARRETSNLILCDLHMPKLDGFEVARQIRRDPQLSEVPLVAVTASARSEEHTSELQSRGHL